MENKKNKKIPMQPGTPAVHAAAAAVALSEIVRERALPLPHELTIPVRNVIEIQSQLFHVGDVDHTHPHHSLIACYTNLHSSPWKGRCAGGQSAGHSDHGPAQDVSGTPT
jgi:hypothetical protein